MINIGTKTIETSRLVLRRLTLNDAQAMYDNWACDPEVTKYLTWQTNESVSVTEAVLSDWIPQYENANYYHWGITLKGDESSPIGTIGVVSMDEKVCKAHIGYCIGKAWWHKGIMSEALEAVIKYLFEKIGFNRIDSRHDPRNPNSGEVMKKCGMKYEGTQIQSDWNNQGICDCAYYAILAEDWIN